MYLLQAGPAPVVLVLLCIVIMNKTLCVNKCGVISAKSYLTSTLCMQLIKRRLIFCHKYDIIFIS